MYLTLTGNAHWKTFKSTSECALVGLEVMGMKLSSPHLKSFHRKTCKLTFTEKVICPFWGINLIFVTTVVSTSLLLFHKGAIIIYRDWGRSVCQFFLVPPSACPKKFWSPPCHAQKNSGPPLTLHKKILVPPREIKFKVPIL